MKTEIDFSKIKAVGIDLDGVVYFGKRPAQGAIQAIEGLRALGLKIFFITNNSGKSRAEIAKKLNDLKIPCDKEEIFTSGYTTILFLQKLSRKVRILIIGSSSLKQEFISCGLKLVNRPPCDFLVVGLDKEYSYEKIALGLEAVRKGAKFIACNIDANFPVETGHVLPGCGAMVAAIEVAANKKPDFIIGKPNAYILELITEKENLKPKEILIIGDSLEGDIAMAEKFGSPAILIGTQKSAKVLTVKSLFRAWQKIKKNKKG